ncbi:MAG TPA: hypothetical protein VIM20_11155 [Candidatus Limnocylindrales bacterium]
MITDFGLQGTPGGSGFDSIAELQRFVDEVVPHVDCFRRPTFTDGVPSEHPGGTDLA